MIEITCIFFEYILAYFFFRNSALGMIDEVKINFKHFPNHYVLPPRWIRNHFKLKKSEIPKYLFFRLCVSMIFGLLAPITSIICMISQLNNLVIGILIFSPCVFVIPDTIAFIIISHAFKKS